MTHKLRTLLLLLRDWKEKEQKYFTTRENYMKFEFQAPQMKLYWNTAVLIPSCTIYGCFCSAGAEVKMTSGISWEGRVLWERQWCHEKQKAAGEKEDQRWDRPTPSQKPPAWVPRSWAGLLRTGHCGHQAFIRSPGVGTDSRAGSTRGLWRWRDPGAGWFSLLLAIEIKPVMAVKQFL